MLLHAGVSAHDTVKMKIEQSLSSS